MTSTTTAAPRPVKRRPRRRRGWLVGLVVAALVLLAGGVYLAGYLAAGDNVPRNATVAGIRIGGMSGQEAVTVLRDELGARAAEPIEARVGEDTSGDKARTVEIDPADAGLSIDYERTVAATGVGRSMAPDHIWRVLTGGGDSDVITDVDQSALDDAVAKAADKLDQKPENATLKFDVPEEGAPKIAKTAGAVAVTVDRPAAAEQLREAYLTSPSVELAATVEDPEISAADVDTLVKDWAEPAISGPIEVKTPKGTFDITPRAIAKSTKFETEGGEIKAKVDPEMLRRQASPEINKNVKLNKPTDAKFTFQGGKPAVVGSKDGEDIVADKLYAAVEPVIGKSDGRAAEVSVEKAKAGLDTNAAERLGVKEVTGEFTTKFPHADYRNTNIGRAASILNGYLIEPGETFSFNDTVGERTPANGFVDGNIISNGRLRMETGGGVSQAVTTLYNAGFFAGLADAEHHPHTLYFSRYPAGREATVAWGSKDLKIKNDSPYGVVIQGIINKSSPGNSGSVTFRMWSTKVYEVKTGTPQKSGFYQQSPITDSSSGCKPQAASPGFTATYWRELYRDGKLAKPRENYSYTYNSARKITCT